ncbi:hypothetical protein AXA44_26295 [Rhodococcus sp. SC4]|nr:hypothetical protein AXA44_26295 [Rhodococcus sp. SC4]
MARSAMIALWAPGVDGDLVITDPTNQELTFLRFSERHTPAIASSQTPLSRALNSLYHGPITLFHNRGDDLDGLHTTLAAAFAEVEITVVGTVAVFAARRPRRLGS